MRRVSSLSAFGKVISSDASFLSALDEVAPFECKITKKK